jgi:bifunctional DNase/RNase/DNA-binding CsgD family transcriptional regulator
MLRQRVLKGQHSGNHEPQTPEDVVLEQDIGRMVRESVATLSPAQRDAVLLFYFAQLSHQEIAAALGIKVSAVKTRLHKARAQLYVRLSGSVEETSVRHVDGDPVVMDVSDIRRIPAAPGQHERHVLILSNADESERVPIWIGRAEATWLALAKQNTPLPRPGPYAFVAALLAGAGTAVEEIHVERLSGEVFYASVMLQGKATRIDARPSDAINLSLVTGAAILVHREVIGACRAGTALARLEQALKGDSTLDASGIAEAALTLAAT